MLEVAIGVVFVFLLVSIIASAVREVLEAKLKTRAAYLERGIRELLHDRQALPDGLARAMYAHPLIYSLYSTTYEPREATDKAPIFLTGRNLPSYIPARNFALAVMDIAARGTLTDDVSGDPDGPPFTLESMRLNIRNLGNPAVQRVLLTAIESANGDIVRARLSIEAWFESGMDRVSGWYKRSTSWIIFWIGLAVAVGLNVDTITISRFFYHDHAARAAVVASAERAVNDSAFLSQGYTRALSELDDLKLPIGWPLRGLTAANAFNGAPGSVGSSQSMIARSRPPLYEILVGWLITALAATIGAPFWFDLLNKFMVIRSTVKPHEKSREESSEDRQTSNDAKGSPNGIRTIELHTEEQRSTWVPRAAVASTPRDASSSIDGCDVDMSGEHSHSAADSGVPVTADEELPPAEGGVA